MQCPLGGAGGHRGNERVHYGCGHGCTGILGFELDQRARDKGGGQVRRYLLVSSLHPPRNPSSPQAWMNRPRSSADATACSLTFQR